MEPTRTASNFSTASNDNNEFDEDDEQPSANMYDTLGYKLLKFFMGLILFLLVVIGCFVNKETVVFFTKRDVKDPTVLSYLLFMNIAPLIPVLGMDLLLRWVREKERTWKAKQKVEKYITRPAAVHLVSVAEAFVEAAGNIVFTVFVLPKVNRTEAVLLMNGLSIVPVLCLIILEWKTRLCGKKDTGEDSDSDEESHTKPYQPANVVVSLFLGILRLVLFAMQIGGIGIFAFTTGLYWEIPVALVLSSFFLWKNFVLMARLPRHWAKAFERNRYTASAIKSIVKIIIYIIFGLLYAVYGLDLPAVTMFTGLYQSSIYSFPFLVLIISGIATYMFVWAACAACLQRVGLALPMLLATPLTILWHYLQCNFPVLIPVPIIGRCNGIADGLLDPSFLTLVAGLLLWISAVIVVAHLWIGIPPNDALMIEKDLWSQPEFSCLFSEQICTMNRSRDYKHENMFDSRRHWTFITTTMYRESASEMKNLVMSLFRIDLDTPPKSTYENWEAHIIFDGAFRKGGSAEGLKYPQYNEFANQLLDILEDELGLPQCKLHSCWYGDMLETKFEGGMTLFVHMKDVTRVKQKKRWSQILYVHLLLDKIRVNPEIMKRSSVYILMIDGDTQFTKKSVDVMRDIMEQDPDRIGAVCGRVLPLAGPDGANPLVWFQKFEYAAGFWLQKTAEHVLGTVLCSPGCFSLVRFQAIYSQAGSSGMVNPGCAIEYYATECESAMDTLMFDQGEDRMLSTLMIKNGWMLQYSATALATTFCPESFRDFFIQRRRWITSTLANLWHLLGSSVEIAAMNRSVSILFMAYTFTVFLSSIMSPATTVLAMIGGLQFGFSTNDSIILVISIGLPMFYLGLCWFYNLDMKKDNPQQKKKKTDIKITVAYYLCGALVVIVAVTAVGLAAQIVQNAIAPASIYIIVLAGLFVITAVVHGETFQLTYGFVFFFFLPTMYLILIIYSMANIHDQSWGTRENAIAGAEKKDSVYSFRKVFRVIHKLFAKCGIDTGYRDEVKEEEVKKEEAKKEEPKKEELKKTEPNANIVINFPANFEVKNQSHVTNGNGHHVMENNNNNNNNNDNENEKKEDQTDAKVPSSPGKKHVVIVEQKSEPSERKRAPKLGQQSPKDSKNGAEKPKGILKKQSFYFPREMLEQKVKEMSSLGSDDWHRKNLKEMKKLSSRLKGYVKPIVSMGDKEKKEERIGQLADLQKSSSFAFFIVAGSWLTLIIAVSLHTNLQVLGSNVVGLGFLILSTMITGIQFVTMIFHRIETLLQTIAYVPMTVSCNLVVNSDADKTAKRKLLVRRPSQVEVAMKEELEEGAFAKLGRALLTLPEKKISVHGINYKKRTET